jgi:hypothetical protein
MRLLRLGAETFWLKSRKCFYINMVDATGLEPVTPCV